MLQTLTHALVAQHLGSVFRLEIGAGQFVAMTLAEAKNLATKSSPTTGQGPNQREPFSLVFRAPQTGSLGQQIYRLHHDELGSFDLFLVPIAREDGGLSCEAIFN